MIGCGGRRRGTERGEEGVAGLIYRVNKRGFCRGQRREILWIRGGKGPQWIVFLMKFVTAIIKPFKLEEVKESLAEAGVSGMTVSEVKGFGRQKGHAEVYRGSEYRVDFLPKFRLEIAVADEQLEAVIRAVSVGAKTGRIGDGKILVQPLELAVRIRTGDAGEDAI